MIQESLSALLEGSNRSRLAEELNRYQQLGNLAGNVFAQPPKIWCSVPGRVEICGNHTDHQNGRVLAGSIDLDMVAAASPTTAPIFTLFSVQDEHTYCVDLDQLEPQPEEQGKTEALMRGIAAGLKKRMLPIGGLLVALDSKIKPGLGLSSSAALEILLITLMDALYGEGQLSPTTKAIIAREAEVDYFGKPCGLMDQLTCALGGLQFIDFENPNDPKTQLIDFDFEPFQVSLAIIDSGDDHKNLTAAFASIAKDMQAIATQLGLSSCRGLNLGTIHQHLRTLREQFGDRAVMRVLHYIDENRRVTQCVDALGQSDLYDFMRFIGESGESSWQWLQNVYPPGESHFQSLALGLALAQQYLRSQTPSAWRVHGGGFAGSALTMMPKRVLPGFQTYFHQTFAKQSVHPISIRKHGIMLCHSPN